MARRLLITYREVPEDRIEAYDRGWRMLQRAAAGIPCQAWRYRSTSSHDSFIEFLEFGGADDPRADAAVSHAIRALDEAGPGTTHEWRDATNPEEPNDRS